jgi:hypothetical protein
MSYDKRDMPRSVASLALALLVVVLSGCGAILNNNPDLRWFVFSRYGASRVCPEMLKTSVSIHLQDRAPAVGRFFPMSCTANVDQARRVMVVSMGGTGYGYLLPAKRIGFSVTASVEYRPDFVVAGDDVYVHARVNRIVDGPHFQTGYIENPVMDLVGNLPPFGNVANLLGNQAVTRTLTQGFTVVHGDHGDDFSLGLLYPPSRPAHPFTVQGRDRFTFANETTDVQPAQLDFLGPFEVTKSGQAIFLSTTVQGAQVNVAVVSKPTGDLWRDNYQTGKPVTPPGPVLYGNVVPPGPVDTRRYNLPPGVYYVVVDNSVAGAQQGGGPFPALLNPLNPLGLAGGGGLARVSYVAQLAE